MIKLIAGAFLLALAGAAVMPSLAEESTSAIVPRASGLTEDATQATASENGSADELKLNGVGDETAAVDDSEQVETAMDPENGIAAGDEEEDD